MSPKIRRHFSNKSYFKIEVIKKCVLKSKFYKKRGATFFMMSHVSSVLSTLPNIGQNHQVSSNLTSF